MADLRFWLKVGRPGSRVRCTFKEGLRERVQTEAKGRHGTRGLARQPALQLSLTPDSSPVLCEGLSRASCLKLFLEEMLCSSPTQPRTN